MMKAVVKIPKLNTKLLLLDWTTYLACKQMELFTWATVPLCKMKMVMEKPQSIKCFAIRGPDFLMSEIKKLSQWKLHGYYCVRQL